MDAVVRAAVMYLVLLLLFRTVGNRPLAHVSVFDLVLLIIIGESTQQALIGDNFSITNALILIVTLLAIEMLLTIASKRSRLMSRLVEGSPVVVMEHGNLLEDRMKHAGVDKWDIMEAARTTQGLDRFEQIKYAVVERDGKISIIPVDEAR